MRWHRQVFGFRLGEIYAKYVGSRWVPVKRDDPDAAAALRHSVRAGSGIWGSICARAKGGSFTPSGSLARWRSLLTLVLT